MADAASAAASVTEKAATEDMTPSSTFLAGIRVYFVISATGWMVFELGHIELQRAYYCRENKVETTDDTVTQVLSDSLSWRFECLIWTRMDSWVDHREFKQIINLMRLRTPVGRQDRSRSHDDDDAPIFQHLFGETGTKSLSFDDFCACRRGLKQEIMRIQFEQYDADSDKTLSPREFGMFLVSHVHQRHFDKWVQRVDKLLALKGTITEDEFMDFNVLLEHLDELKVAMDLVMQEQGVDKAQFQRAAKAAVRGCKHSKPVTPLQIDILFALFDREGDGHLSTTDFIKVMHTRKDRGLKEPRDIGVFTFFKHFKNCMKTIV